MAIGNLKKKRLKSISAQGDNEYSLRSSSNDKEIIDRIKSRQREDAQKVSEPVGYGDKPISEGSPYISGEFIGVEQNSDHQYETALMPSTEIAESEPVDIVSSAGEREEREHMKRGGSGSASKDTGRTVILTGIILDGTLSFVTVFPAVYYAIEEFLNRMERKQRQYPDYSFKYSLTILHDKAETISFSGTHFTSRVEDVLEKIRSMEFYGGSNDGREDLRGAINTQLETLNQSSEKEQDRVFRGLFMFTDSLPPENEMSPNFQNGEPRVNGNYTNYGLRFAEFFVHNDNDFMPRMLHVDKRGMPTTKAKNCTRIHSIKELIRDDAKATSEIVGALVDQILNQTSVDLMG